MNIVSNIFIGSSTETLDAGEALRAALAKKFGVTLWHVAFRAGEMLLPSLIGATANHDFGVFLFGPDDELKIRGKKLPVVRDNVLFELGIFMGALGHPRSFLVEVKTGNERVRIPNDLDGYLRAGKITRKGKQWDVVTAAEEIARTAARLGPALRNSHNEVRTMIINLDDQEIVAKGRKYFLGSLLRNAAAAHGRVWLPRSKPGDVVEHIRVATDSNKVADHAYWWLVVEGVFKFDGIDHFAGSSWDWSDSIDYVHLSERGVALLNELRTGRH